MWTQKGPSQVSTLQRCLYFSQTSLIWTPKGQRQVSANVLNTDTKGTETSVCITVKPLNSDTKETEPSVLITEVSVLQSNLLIQIPKRQNQVSSLQRCLYYSQTSLIQISNGQSQVSALQTCLYYSQTP